MLNNYILVGRLARDFDFEEKDGKQVATSTLAVTRQYKNDNGEYETDLFPIYTYSNIASNCAKYCKKGDLIAIRGALTMKDNNIHLGIDKISFLASKNKIDKIEQKKDEEYTHG